MGNILSTRELIVLELIAKGYSNSQISKKLIVTTSQIKSEVHDIIHKLGVKNRIQAVVQASLILQSSK